MVTEKNYLVEKLKQAGIPRIYTSMKKLSQANEIRLGAVLVDNEVFSRSGSKRTYIDQSGARQKRKKLFDRETRFKVVIAESDEDKCEAILIKFLEVIRKGLEHDRNWINLDIGDMDWVSEDDSILRAKMAVQFSVTFYGGVYKDVRLVSKPIGQIDIEKEEPNVSKEIGDAGRGLSNNRTAPGKASGQQDSDGRRESR